MSYYSNAVIKAEAIATARNYLTDEQAETVTTLFPLWEVDTPYAIDDRVQYNELLYKCVQAHTSQSDWTPDITPALWARTSADEYPEWVQPTGAQDSYMIGDKCSYNGDHWICTADYNVYAPDVYGWEKV